MRSDHSNGASSPRSGAGGGLCKAFKDMKSKVATHTGMSLSFVELVATSPAVGLLPALAPSPRSPSALLHRHMHLGHNIYSFVVRRPSSAEQSTCVADTESSGTQSPCAVDTENLGTQSKRVVDAEDSGAQSTFNIESETAQSLSSSSSCDLPCGQASASASCVLLHTADKPLASTHPSSSSTCQVCGHSHTDPSSASTHPSLSSSSDACEHPSSSSSTCDLPCSFPSSSASIFNFSSRHPSLSSVSCNSSSSLSCNLPCAHPSSSLSCGLSCGHVSPSDDLPYSHKLAASLSPSHNLSSEQCDLFSEDSACSHSYAPLELVSDMHMPPTDKLYRQNVDCCSTIRTSSPIVSKRAVTILRVTSQIPSTSARVLYFLVTLIFALSSISKSVYKSCMWVSRRVVHPHTVWHYIRVVIRAGRVQAKDDALVRIEDDGCSNEKECFKVDVSVGQQSSHSSKVSCMKRSKFLKSKLRSSFKSLSVQVPRKAFAPLHFNSFPHTSSSSPSSPSPSDSDAVVNSSPTARKTRMLKGPAFACKLTKSFNQKQPLAVSPSPSGSQSRSRSQNHMQDVPTSETVFLKLSSCEAKEHSSNREISTNVLGNSVMAPVIVVPVALCALFYGKGVAFLAVTAWLVGVSIANSICSLWRKPRICSL